MYQETPGILFRAVGGILARACGVGGEVSYEQGRVSSATLCRDGCLWPGQGSEALLAGSDLAQFALPACCVSSERPSVSCRTGTVWPCLVRPS